MRLAVLASPDSWYLSDLKRATGTRHELQCLPFTQLVARQRSSGGSCEIFAGDVSLETFDAVLVRTMPPGSLEQVVFRMDLLGRLQQQGTPVINSPRAVEAAVDKYLATAKIAAAGLTTPETIVCQTAEDAMTGFESLGGDVVVKPLFGGEGRGLMRVEDRSLAIRVFKTLAQIDSVIYLQRFIPHNGFDIRLLVIGERILSIARRNPNDWRTNISRGAIAEAYDVDPEMIEIARAAAEAVDATIAGVDILPGRDGQRYVLEVNAVPGWRATAKALDLDVADLILKYVESQVFDQ